MQGGEHEIKEFLKYWKGLSAGITVGRLAASPAY